jgi:hypothetical protein
MLSIRLICCAVTIITTGAALRMWEETGSGQAWATKAPKSITASLLFCSRAEFRYAPILQDLAFRMRLVSRACIAVQLA